MSLRWTREDYEAYLRNLAAKDRAPGSAAKLEPNFSHAAKKTHETQKAHPRYRLAIGYQSKRRADPGNRCYKWAVDGLVKAGILGDDTWEWITEIKETEQKAEGERTVIEVWEIK